MYVISRKKLRKAATRHADLEAPPDKQVQGSGGCSNDFSRADATGKWTGLDIKGKQLRLIAEINDSYGRLYIQQVLTHSECSRGGWKR
jgi:mRNA-degrading endonuclease HigB of HigAB toxin-antitoxin module